MTWLDIGLLWIVLSVGLPILFGLRYTRLKEYRQRLDRTRTRLHRFQIGHRLRPIVH